MKKFCIMTLLFCAVMSFCIVIASADDQEEIPIGVGVTTVTQSLYFRDAPSTSGQLIGRIPPDAFLIIYDKINSFYKVSYNGQIGYASSNYIDATFHEFSISYSQIPGRPFDCLSGVNKEYHCSDCGYVYCEETVFDQHVIYRVEMSFSTDCEEESCTREWCDVCGWEEVTVTPAPGHLLVVGYKALVGKEINCEDGYIKVSHCEREGCTYVDYETVLTGHQYREVARIEPTHSSSGTSTMECTICSHREYISLPALVDDGMTSDFFFTGSNIYVRRVEIIRDLRPRYELHLWRNDDRNRFDQHIAFGNVHAFRHW